MNGVVLVQAISEAIKEVAALVHELVSGREVARLKYQQEAAMNYVFANEKAGKYEGINAKEQKKQLLHFRKRIFDSA